MARRLTPGGIVRRYAVLATVWIVVSGYLLGVSVDDPALREIVEAGKGLLFVAVTSGLLFLLLRAWADDGRQARANTASPGVGVLPLGTYPLVTVLLAVALTVPVLSFVIARHLAPGFEQDAHANLSAIARLQAAQVDQWLDEHHQDARLIMGDASLREWVDAVAHGREIEPEHERVTERLRSLQSTLGYEGIQVLDLSGTPLLTLGHPQPVTETELSSLALSDSAIRVHGRDLHVGDAGAMVLRLIAVLHQDTQVGPIDIGFVTLTLRPDNATYPLIHPWPTAAATGRTLLVRRSVPVAVEVKNIDAQDGTPRVRVSQPFVPTFPLGASLQEGVPGTLMDKRRGDAAVLATHHPISGSNWQVVASVEHDEIMNPLRDTVFWINLVAFVAAFLVSGALLLLWHAQNRSRYLAERQRASALLDFHIKNSPLAAIEWDQDFRVKRWSPRAAEIFGWSAHEAEGRQPSEWPFVHPDDAEAVSGAVRDLIEGKASRNQNTNRNLTKHGDVLHCEWYNSARLDAHGRVESIFSLVQDVTQKVGMERAISESEEQFRTLIEGAPDTVFVQIDHRFAFVNPAACRLFGAGAPQDLIGQPVMERFRADFHPIIEGRIRGLNERGEAQDLLEEVWLRLDGAEVSVEVAAQPLRFQGRDGALVFARNIFRRKDAERERDFNARLLAMASRSARFGGWEVDLQSDRVFWSDEVCRVLEMPLGTIVTMEEGIGCYAPEWRYRGRKLFAACARDGTPFDEEMEILTASGRRLWVRTLGEAVRNSKGAIVRVEGAFQDITERREAEQRTRVSEAKLRAVTETSPDPIIMTDDAGKLVYCNPAVEKTLGYATEELIGRDLHQALAPERYRAEIVRGYEAFARSGAGPFIGGIQELGAMHRDGHEVPVELSLSSLQIDGRWHAVGVLRDITGRKQFEANLSLQARRAEALLELPKAAEQLDESSFMQRGQELAEDLTNSRIAFIHFVQEDQDSIELVTWSRRTLNEYCRAPFQQHYPIADAGIWADALRQRKSVMFNDYASCPNRHGLPEGHAELQRLISVPVIENGRVTMLAGVGNKDADYTDVDVETVRLIAEQIWSIVQRRRSAQRISQLSLAIEQSPNSIVITNLAAEIEYVNESFLTTTGYTRSEVLGQNPHILQSGRTPRAHYDTMWAALRRGEPWKGEFYNRRKDGTEYVEFGHIAPLRQASGEITNYVGVKEDITEKKRIGRELDRHRHHLEELVTQRTAELLDARVLAESANRAKSAFLANMSHEIRTPMNGVLGMVELLWNTELTKEQADMVEIIRDSGRSLTSLIDDILDFSKIEAGRMEVEQIPISVRNVVEGLCVSLAPFASYRGVDLSGFVAPEIPERVLGDEVRLRQMLHNLIGNAIKFSRGLGKGQGRVCVRVEPSASDPSRATFMISDNGVGISERAQEGLFQPFTQAEASTTRRFGGTGLGLAICKRLADLMGGDISVSSALGEGSLFTLDVHFDTPAEQPAAPIPDLTGVHCILIETGEFCAGTWGASCGVRDIARHLEYAGATAPVFRGLDAARASALEPGEPAVVIHLAGRNRAPAETDPAGFGPLPEIRITWGVKNAFYASGVSLLDAATLTRDNLMKAVTIAVERAEASDVAGVRVRRELSLPGHTEPRALDARILVVEDDAINRKVIRKQLEVLGYRADLAVNGVEALQKWRVGGYDLVLTDLHMPEMDGHELTRQIRHLESAARVDERRRPRTPIIALTANALRGEAEKGLALGMDDYLTKPLELKVLDAALQRHLHTGASLPEDSDPYDTSRPSPAATVLPLFDVNVLKGLVGDDQETVHSLLDEYLKTLHRTWEDIENATRRGDGTAIGAAAHKLKSSSRSVGAARFGELCEGLESAGKSGDMEAISPLLHEASGLRPVLEAAIRSFLGGSKP